MDNQLYWVSSLTYAIVIGMILLSSVRIRKVNNKIEKKFGLMAVWVLFFCIQDTVWGLCAAHVIGSSFVFFISSTIFHTSTVITTFFWLNYVLEFLGDKVKHKKLFLVLDGFVIGFQFILLTINFFKPTVFTIVNGDYVTEFLRPFCFINQYVVYLLIGITTLFFVIRKDTRNNTHYRSVFFFATAPILLGVFQLMFPNGPFYSLGYFLGFFIIHIFVVTKDREMYFNQETQMQKIIELNRELERKQQEIDGQFDILKSMSRVYDYINLLDFESCVATRFDDMNSGEEEFDLEIDPQISLNKEQASRIIETEYDRFLEFTNLSTLEERMKEKRLVSFEFVCKDGKWMQAMYIRIGDDVNSPLHHVAYTLRNITKDRKRENQVYNAMANLVYSLHIFDVEDDTMERLIETEILKKLIGNEESGQRMANSLMYQTCKDEYLDMMLKFVDFSTITERTMNKKIISCEFLGKFHGWTRMTLMPIEMKNNKVKKMVAVTQIIDLEKSERINLIYKSTTDELTGLYNRRTYEEDVDAITQGGDLDNYIIIALDVNGLKSINDTFGHKAGDELIIGASHCIYESFNTVGKSYRIGGDEFMVIARCDEEKLQTILTNFESTINNWTGTLVSKLSVSYGYSVSRENPTMSIRDLASVADKNMYKNKAEYYRQNGKDRRNAFKQA